MELGRTSRRRGRARRLATRSAAIADPAELAGMLELELELGGSAAEVVGSVRASAAEETLRALRQAPGRRDSDRGRHPD